MSVFIYRRAVSTSARVLADAVDGNYIRSQRQCILAARAGNKIVCWGSPWQWETRGLSLLNNRPLLAKLTEVKALNKAGVPTVETSATPRQGWLGRSSRHVGGSDLLRPPRQPDYWVKKEDIVQEYRVHSFKGHSIRAGVKRVRDGFFEQTAHRWIRSWEAGWRISYDGESVRQRHRDLAHAAVAALKLDFGAVDIGERADGSLLVLEVNRAPGLEGGTIGAYAKAITAWMTTV